MPVSRKDANYACVRLLSQLFGESFRGRANSAFHMAEAVFAEIDAAKAKI